MYQIVVWERTGHSWRIKQPFDTQKQAADYAIAHVAEHRTWQIVPVATLKAA